ncbi:uncharacterized protein LOC141685431 [Apium graveolens]|uniref:uncharacterized protein LOC141685431 n=1 Tax=Apium graveolens TaxID=4045 RepID=UPI003D7A2D00
MALQYPLLFPAGEDGYHDEISYVDPENQSKKKRLQSRHWWLRTHLTILRNDLYSNIAKKNFQDALAICSVVVHPDIFVMMTCNSQWNEIQEMMKKLPGCSTFDSPDIISRVFHLKLEQLLDDIKTKHYFGVCIGVEFQKRGIPHVHLLIWLNSELKKNLTNNVDNYVSAELPDPEADPVGYAVVQSFMIHGPCGIVNPKCAYMKDFKCTKHFPKKLFNNYDRYQAQTSFDQSGFPIYKHRKTSITVSKGKCNLDNQWVVSYSRDLSNGGNTEKSDEAVDEINEYFDGRYIYASEAVHRIFGFPIHHRSIYVHRLSFHLPGERSCTFREQECFKKIWTPRKRGKQIGHLLYTHHSAGELWFLWLLLSKVRSPTSFDNLKIVNGVQYRTLKDACRHYGLLDDDNEWHEVLSDAAKSGFPDQIRRLFVHIIVNCQVTDIRHLWNEHWKNMIDDIILGRRDRSGGLQSILNEKQLECYALAEHFKQLPIPPRSYLQTGLHNLVIDETSYNMSEMAAEFDKLFPKCYPKQLLIYNAVLQSVKDNAGGLFFAYRCGGCGKTFLWKTLIYKLRSMGLIVLPVAYSGKVATLMPGGRTAHSRFKIPIILDDYSSYGIGHDSDIAELIKRTSLIIWDEAHMQHLLLGGDFRQILPVISLGSRGDIVSGCITRSYLWHNSQIYLLKKNMRLNQGQSEEEVVNLKNFADWVLDIGNGKVAPPLNGRYEVVEEDIIVPAQFCDLEMK